MINTHDQYSWSKYIQIQRGIASMDLMQGKGAGHIRSQLAISWHNCLINVLGHWYITLLFVIQEKEGIRYQGGVEAFFHQRLLHLLECPRHLNRILGRMSYRLAVIKNQCIFLQPMLWLITLGKIDIQWLMARIIWNLEQKVKLVTWILMKRGWAYAGR